ncbi:WD repeat-containing protein JIP5 [Blastomyces gilchristii SLH14081]|uniref:WD repeat-containing protein JIP5 n=1 Tax=Blastomyces gilchristii (strain SLH14081) TaxID=559298 RepID=A0A179UVX8_BLAGS|nr:WD repeat-containing protein JIP5 [Blastomyces gilchristii SLH14081]OAT11953.1 WD repeat-containing protein JIP5 [Blastomyces gilchristii SLH14081]
MFDNVCSLPLSSDLFAQAIHPTEPLFAVGLSSGHVQTFRIPPTNDGSTGLKNGFGHIDTAWRTRRHKASCRCLGFGIDGETLYSAGADGWVKAAKAETGVVNLKIAVPRLGEGTQSRIDPPTVIHALSPETLILSTDSGALHLFDLRVPPSSISQKAQQTHHPHDDYVSSLTPLPPSEASTSGFSKQWVTTGGTTIAVTDLRRGVLVRSEDQEEELISSVYVSGLKAGGSSKGEKLVVGGASGVLTLWEKGAWDDQDERIVVDRQPDGGESLEVLSLLPDSLGAGKVVAVGQSDGAVQFVQLGINKVISKVVHDELEGVAGLGFDVGGRMISGGGSIVKVWHEAVEGEGDDESEGEEQEDQHRSGKRFIVGSDDNSDDDSDNGDKQGQKKRKKRKKGKGKEKRCGPHVIAFKGLD